MAHIMPASWQHWSKTLQSSKHTFKASGKVHTSKTLFLAQVPSHAGTEELQALAKPLPGYVPFSARRVRCAPFSSPFPAVTTPRAPAPTARWKHHTAVCVRGSPDRCLRLPLLAASSSGMAFLDFESKQHATDALSKLQGHTWKAGEKGLLVSYDKDDEEDRGGTARRQMEELRRRREELEASYTRLHCAACGSFACKVVVDLEKLPLRRTDGSRVVGSAQLMALDCAKGAAKKIKREKGIEKQYYLNCVQCDVTLAYRSTPFGTPGKYVYLIAKALRARTTEEGKRDRCARPPSLPSWIDTVHATRPPPPPSTPPLFCPPLWAGALLRTPAAGLRAGAHTRLSLTRCTMRRGPGLRRSATVTRSCHPTRVRATGYAPTRAAAATTTPAGRTASSVARRRWSRSTPRRRRRLRQCGRQRWRQRRRGRRRRRQWQQMTQQQLRPPPPPRVPSARPPRSRRRRVMLMRLPLAGCYSSAR